MARPSKMKSAAISSSINCHPDSSDNQSSAVKTQSLVNSIVDSPALKSPDSNAVLETALQGSGFGFDDPGNYGIGDRGPNGEEGLLRIEILSLLADSTSEDAFLISHESNNTSQPSLGDISHIADQILCNLAIVEHDNHVLIFQHCWEGRLVEFSTPLYLQDRALLSRRYNIDDPKQMPQTINQPGETKKNSKVYFGLVDYMTSSIARFMLRSTVSIKLLVAIFAVLARWRLKLKAISYDPVMYAEDALTFGEDAIRQTQSGSFKSRFQGLYDGVNTKTDIAPLALLDRIQKELVELSNPTKKSGPQSLMATLQAATRRRTEQFHGVDEDELLQYESRIHLRVHLASILQQIAGSLYSDSTKSVQRFETFTAVYTAGLEQPPLRFVGDRNGNISTSSDSSHLRNSIPAFELLKKNAQKLHISQSQMGPPRASCVLADGHISLDQQTTANIIWQVDYKDEKVTRLTKVDEVVSMIVSLALTSPSVAQETRSLILNIPSSDENEVIEPKASISKSCFFHLQTKKHADESCETIQGLMDKNNIIPVSCNPCRGLRSPLSLPHLPITIGMVRDPRVQREIIDQYSLYDEIMKHWITSESSITVGCKPYIYLVLFVSAIFVLGGLAMGFTVGQRISGVDPFGLANYSWLLVGVLLVLAKSRYVTDWPWHDFLRMHVVCSSVSDLAEVGHIDKQIILLKLLLEEHKSTLRTTGPYNGMFNRKVGQGEGFAIDVPVALDTLFAAGFIVLKVRGEEGDNVVVLDARKGTGLQVVPPRGEGQEWLSCVDVGGQVTQSVDKENVSSKSKSAATVLYLSRNDISWNKILGFYVEKVSFG